MVSRLAQDEWTIAQVLVDDREAGVDARSQERQHELRAPAAVSGSAETDASRSSPVNL